MKALEEAAATKQRLLSQQREVALGLIGSQGWLASSSSVVAPLSPVDYPTAANVPAASTFSSSSSYSTTPAAPSHGVGFEAGGDEKEVFQPFEAGGYDEAALTNEKVKPRLNMPAGWVIVWSKSNHRWYFFDTKNNKSLWEYKLLPA